MKRSSNLKELVDVLMAITEQKSAYKIEVYWDGRGFHWHIKVPSISAEDFRKVTRRENSGTIPGVTSVTK